MTIYDLLAHMAGRQRVAIYMGKKKEFDGSASAGILQLPNCILHAEVKMIGSMDYNMETKERGLFDHSVVTIVANEQLLEGVNR